MKKTISFAGLHFSVAFSIAYLLTGDPIIGGLIALTEPAVNTIAYYFHEKIWETNWAKKKFKSTLQKTMSFASVHFSIAFIVSYLLTGNIIVGGVMALIEPSVNTVVYYFHDKVWDLKKSKQLTIFSNLN